MLRAMSDALHASAPGPAEAAGAVPVVSDDSRVEQDVGIAVFATPHAPGFSAVLKHRCVCVVSSESCCLAAVPTKCTAD